MGRVHKKKLAEYADAADEVDQRMKKERAAEENEEQHTHENAENESEVENETQNASKNTEDQDNDTDVDDDDDDDFKSLQGDNKSNGETEQNGAVNRKRKAAAAAVAAAVAATDKTGKSGADEANSSDDEPLDKSGSGSGTGATAKRGRKVGKAKAGGKGKGAKGGKNNVAKKISAKNDTEEENGEEEYEVKDIVGHKVERGVSFYLIRWKGYTKADDTWEAEETLSCPELIEKFNKKASNETGTKSAKKAGSPTKRGRPKGATPNDPNKEWEVEKIIDYAEEKNGRLFRIRWKGFGARFDTWEPEENLFCDDIIKKFMQRMKSQANVSFKQLREEPKKTKRLVNETVPRTNYRNKIGRTSKRSKQSRVYYGDSDE